MKLCGIAKLAIVALMLILTQSAVQSQEITVQGTITGLLENAVTGEIQQVSFPLSTSGEATAVAYYLIENETYQVQVEVYDPIAQLEEATLENPYWEIFATATAPSGPTDKLALSGTWTYIGGLPADDPVGPFTL